MGTYVQGGGLRRGTRQIGLMLIALALAGCAGKAPPAAPTTSDTLPQEPLVFPEGGFAPATLAAGDEWTERTVVTGATSADTLQTRRVAARGEEVIVGGTTHVTYRTEGSHLGTTDTMWLRESDLALVKHFTQAETSRRTLTYDPPCGLRWPLVSGQRWNATCEERVRTEGKLGITETTAPRVRTYAVEGLESVVVQGRGLASVKVSFTDQNEDGSDGAAGTLWYAPTACGIVKSEHAKGGQQTTRSVLAFRCAATA